MLFAGFSWSFSRVKGEVYHKAGLTTDASGAGTAAAGTGINVITRWTGRGTGGACLVGAVAVTGVVSSLG